MKSTQIIVGSIIVLIVLVAVPAAADLSFDSSCPETITKGDAFTITGTGATNGSIAVIVLGRNYFHTFTAEPDDAGNFSLTLKPEETKTFSSGQYAFVIQDPGANGQFEISTRALDGGNILILDRGVTVADIGTARDLKASVSSKVSTLMGVSGRSGVDDILTPVNFFVELPTLHFSQKSDPVTGHLVLDRSNPPWLLFNGTTNMAPENVLTARVYDVASRKEVMNEVLPTITPADEDALGSHMNLNFWQYSLDTERLPHGEYIITIGWENETWCGTATALFVVPDALGTARVVSQRSFF